MGMHSLLQLFHEGNPDYRKEYERRFSSENTIRLDIELRENIPFFVYIHRGIYEQMLRIERINRDVVFTYANLPGKAIKQYEEHCLINEIVLTNKIEGVVSTRKEITEILNDLSEKTEASKKTRRFTNFVNQYRALMEPKNISIQSSGDIRKIYDNILIEDIRNTDTQNLPDGKVFRKGVVVVQSETGKEIHRGLSPEEVVIETMDRAIAFLHNEEIDILIRVAVFHYLFGYIHPFYDGNGRLSRFISSYLLTKNLNPIIGFRLSFTIRENISRYYKAFRTCNAAPNMGDLTPFVEMFLDVLEQSMLELARSLQNRRQQLDRYSRQLDRLPGGEDEKNARLYASLLQAALFSDVGVSKKEIAGELGVSESTLFNWMRKLPEKMILKNRIGREYHYLLNMDEVLKYTE